MAFIGNPATGIILVLFLVLVHFLHLDLGSTIILGFLLIWTLFIIFLIYRLIIIIAKKENSIDFIQSSIDSIKNWSFERYKKHEQLVSTIIIAEFILSQVSLLFLITSQIIPITPDSFQIQKLMTFFYDRTSFNFLCPFNFCRIVSASSLSFEKVSIIVVFLSGLVIYTYFFEMLGTLSKKMDETQKKYFGFFFNSFIFTLCYLLFILLFDLVVITQLFPLKNDLVNQIIPIWIPTIVSGINIIAILPLAIFYKNNHEKYEFIQNFNKYRKNNPKEFGFSSHLFIITVVIAIIGYFQNFDLFVLVFLETTLLFMHFWTSRFQNLPHGKNTIILKKINDIWKRFERIENVFILEESKEGFYIIITEDNVQRKIMASSIEQIINCEVA
jgi:hypothetical protein